MLALAALALAAQLPAHRSADLAAAVESMATKRGWRVTAGPQIGKGHCVVDEDLSAGPCSISIKVHSFDKVTDAYTFMQPYGRAEENMTVLKEPALENTGVKAYVRDYKTDPPSNLKAFAGAGMWITGTVQASFIAIQTSRAHGVGLRIPQSALVKTHDDAIAFASAIVSRANSPYEPLRTMFEEQARGLGLTPNDQVVQPTIVSEKGYQEVLLSRRADDRQYQISAVVLLVPRDDQRAQSLRSQQVTSAGQIPIDLEALRRSGLIAVTYGRRPSKDNMPLPIGIYGVSGHCLVIGDLRPTLPGSAMDAKLSGRASASKAIDRFAKLMAALSRAAKDIPDSATGWK